MDDIEKHGGTTSAPRRIIIADSDPGGISSENQRRFEGRRGSRSGRRHSEDDITPIQNTSTVPIEYRTL